MTREEAMEILKDWDGYFIGHSSDDVTEALDMAIKALEQEPILDKIRTEIQENINYNKKMNYKGIVAGLLVTLDIIDTYRNEVSE